MNDTKRLALARELYRAIALDTPENSDVQRELLWLITTMLVMEPCGSLYLVTPRDANANALFKVVQRHFKKGHPIYQFISVET